MSVCPPPDFIIIGAMRAGTTALAAHLSHHPDIGMSRLKETDYFIAEKNLVRGEDWYRSLFPAGRPVRGEASPNYSKCDVFPGVPARISAARPDAKLIYIVRDPVDRFWSQYRHTWLMRGGLPAPDDLFDGSEGAHILAGSMYHRQLSAYLDIFPAMQILVVDFDDYTANTADTTAAICGFLGVRAGALERSAPTANSAESLARTPGWALRVSQAKAMTGLRAMMPPGLKENLRGLLTRAQGAPRATPPISESAGARVRAALAEDAARFRAMTGRAFPSWSV